MKKNLSNAERPIKSDWAKYIAAAEKHTSKKKLRFAYKIELINFQISAFFT